jgi:hypothetical protein
MANLLALTDLITRDTMEMIRDGVKAPNSMLTNLIIVEVGELIREMDVVFISVLLESDMKECGIWIKRSGKLQKPILME